MVKQICDAARAARIPVSVCGEMAGDPLHTLVLMGLGVTELSMNGPSIPVVKKVIRGVTAADARALVERLLTLTFAEEIEREVRAEMHRRFPELFESAALPADPVG
jgi:phosphotransferase system enzyme I (PtsI)